MEKDFAAAPEQHGELPEPVAGDGTEVNACYWRSSTADEIAQAGIDAVRAFGRGDGK